MAMGAAAQQAVLSYHCTTYWRRHMTAGSAAAPTLSRQPPAAGAVHVRWQCRDPWKRGQDGGKSWKVPPSTGHDFSVTPTDTILLLVGVCDTSSRLDGRSNVSPGHPATMSTTAPSIRSLPTANCLTNHPDNHNHPPSGVQRYRPTSPAQSQTRPQGRPVHALRITGPGPYFLVANGSSPKIRVIPNPAP